MIKNYPQPSGSAAGNRRLSLEDFEEAGIRNPRITKNTLGGSPSIPGAADVYGEYGEVTSDVRVA
jgi:hypothetical protein